MLAAAHYWAKNVEPIFGKITKRAEDLMVGSADQAATSPGVLGRKEAGVD